MAVEKFPPLPESVHDLLHHRSSELDVFFSPQNVALIGATETPGSVGRTLLKNLISTPFGGTVFPVNPKRPNVLGIKAYPKISDIPAKVDLAVIVTPAATVPELVRDCVKAGVQGCVIISAGFKEVGPQGAEYERLISSEARGKMRIIGPNCLGVMNPRNGFNATFAPTLALPGHVAMISQSGALLTAILDWSIKEKVGFSVFASIGSMLDVGWGDLIDYLGDDPHTHSIVIYMETIGDARAFLSAAREVALTKPIIVIKPGRSQEAARAAASHTGSLAGADDVLDAAFRRAGVLRVDRVSDLFYMAEILGKQPRPRGRRLTMVTNAGGPGVLATDTLMGGGGQLAPISAETLKKLNTVLPAAWSHNNPVDVLGDAPPDRYKQALDICSQDPNSDAYLVILTPQAMTDSTETARALTPFARLKDKPVLACWMGGDLVQPGKALLQEAGIPTFGYPDTACRAFNYMWRYNDNLKAIYETPSPVEMADEGPSPREKARELLGNVQADNRTLLTEKESKDILRAYHIPTVSTSVAATEDTAVKMAKTLGFPVVLKLNSQTITHKTDVGGVKLNLRDEKAVRQAFKEIRKAVPPTDFDGVTVQPMVSMKDAYELILGSSVDPQFGPTLLFGLGGQLVEVFKDRALGLPPLNTTLARRVMEQTKIYTALKGVRGRSAVDLKALEQLFVRFSYLVVDNPRIKEIDINPLLASANGLLALDARIVLHEPRVSDASLPRTAIRPYPTQYMGKASLKNGKRVTIRPILHQDEPLLIRFHEALSEQSVYLRYFQALNLSQRVTHERLARRCFIDYDREMALVVEGKTPAGEKAILGVARLIKHRGRREAECAMLISDAYQKQGLGTELLKRLIGIAKDERVKRIVADVLPENHGMRRLFERFGFTCHETPGDNVIKASLTL